MGVIRSTATFLGFFFFFFFRYASHVSRKAKVINARATSNHCSGDKTLYAPDALMYMCIYIASALIRMKTNIMHYTLVCEITVFCICVYTHTCATLQCMISNKIVCSQLLLHEYAVNEFFKRKEKTEIVALLAHYHVLHLIFYHCNYGKYYGVYEWHTTVPRVG